jgi:hypothetical protein
MSEFVLLPKEDWRAFESRIFKKLEEMNNSKGQKTIQIYTQKELEDLLKSTSNTIKRFREEGLSFIRINGSGDYRYAHEDLVEFLSKHKYNHLAELL